MEQQFCQSCSMPLTSDEVKGTEQNGQKSEEYCVYCYENGVFKQPEITMQEMIDVCVGYMKEDGMAEQEARTLLNQVMPNLKRWSAQH